MFPEKIHQHIYFWSAILMAFGLPLGEFFMSVGTIAFSTNWVLEGGFKAKVKTAIKHKTVVGLLLFLLIYLVGILWTSDIDFALHDLKIKAPFFVLPFFFSSKPIFSSEQIKHILYVFVGATLTSVFVSLYTYIDLSSLDQPFDAREISIFISHIRQSMMVVFSIVILTYFSSIKQLKIALSIVLVLILFGYLFVLQSLTGLVFIGLFFICLPLFLKGFTKRMISISSSLFLLIVIGLGALSVQSYSYYFTPLESTFEPTTKLGNKYNHDLRSHQLENGYYVWRHVSNEELEEAWGKRSSVPFSDSENAQSTTQSTLIRYLTSKQLNKDAEGVEALSDEEIKRIEKGIVSTQNLTGLRKRIDDVVFELASFIDAQNPSHNSFLNDYTHGD